MFYILEIKEFCNADSSNGTHARDDDHNHLGSSKNTKFLYELAPKLFPFLLGILITMQNFKVLAGLEVLPPDPHFQTQKYKEFSESVKEKYSQPVFQLLNSKIIF